MRAFSFTARVAIVSALLISIGSGRGSDAPTAPTTAPSISELMAACSDGNYNNGVANILLRFPNTVQAANDAAMPLLAAATHSGSTSCVAYLIAKGADANLPDSNGSTPLEIAVRSGNQQMVELISPKAGFYDLSSFAILGRMDLALETFSRDSTGKILRAAIYKFRLSVPANCREDWKLLVAAMEQAEGKSRSELLYDCLRRICMSRDYHLESELLGRASDVIRQRLSLQQRRSLAITAIQQSNDAMLSLMRNTGLDVDSAFGLVVQRQMHQAINDNNERRAILIARSGLLEKPALSQCLPLAAALGRDELFFELIAIGIDKDSKDEKGRTALMLAAGRAYGAIVEYLLAIGADSRLQDNDNKDALAYAHETGGNETTIAALERALSERKKERH